MRFKVAATITVESSTHPLVVPGRPYVMEFIAIAESADDAIAQVRPMLSGTVLDITATPPAGEASRRVQ